MTQLQGMLSLGRSFRPNCMHSLTPLRSIGLALNVSDSRNLVLQTRDIEAWAEARNSVFLISRADAEPPLTFRMAYKLHILAPTDYHEASRVTTTANGTAFQTFRVRGLH